MRKRILFISAILLMATLWAQSPEKMSYQAVIRNSSDKLIQSEQIGIRINILQGSATGTAVYVETQKPITNANGLVSLSIGAGTVVSGVFSAIDWSDGPYFIKTETDINGGTSYTITGTSQLLSVPYALHAKTAESITGGISESDPVYAGSQAKNITASHIAKLNSLSGTNIEDQDLSGLATKTALGDSIAQVRSEIPDVSGFATIATVTTSIDGKVDKVAGKGLSTEDYTTAEKVKLEAISGTNTGDQDLGTLATKTALDDSVAQIRSEIPTAADGSETKLIAGTNIEVTGAGTNANPYAIGMKPLAIGQSYQGGVIFWLDATRQHGLIAATKDQSAGIQWSNGTSRFTGTTGDGLYAGLMNTALIVASQLSDNQSGSFAAKVCADYSVTFNGIDYGDWYLPSKYELKLLYQQKDVIGGFSLTYYWSSTESDYNNLAWRQNFNGGYLSGYSKDDTHRVRAIRAF